jgi:hypothetical protein
MIMTKWQQDVKGKKETKKKKRNGVAPEIEAAHVKKGTLA